MKSAKFLFEHQKKFKTLKTPSQQQWLRKTERDPYIKLRDKKGYRSRACFKLIEMDDKFHILPNSHQIVELGSAPGSWTQVIAERCTGKLISVDLIFSEKVPSKTLEQVFINGDFTQKEILDRVNENLSGKLVDIVLSDMAPNTTGIKDLDHGKLMVSNYGRLNTLDFS